MAFKMKRSPVKKNLSNFFSSLGKQLRAGQKEKGIFSEKGKAEKKEMRKTGESKFQYDVRKKKEKSKQAKINKPATPTPEKTVDTSKVNTPKVKTKKKKVSYKDAYKNADKKKYPTLAEFIIAAKAYNAKNKK